MKKILIIEDETHLRQLYQTEFTEEGYEVVLAKNGFEGISLCKRENPDLVVVDIRMPGMDGLDTISHILEHDRSRPVIIHSAYPHYQDNFMSWNADAFVVKSGDLSILKEKVNAFLQPAGMG
ncbi:MAG: response regulator [Candidatus Omnitrophica bacterium]|nr:response regulator [Candidatus Omnitrophota bacterium]